MKKSQLAARVLFIFTMLCIVTAALLICQAREVGDTKSLSGDVEKATELERIALLFYVGASLSIGGIYAVVSCRQIVLRIFLAMFIAAATLPVFMITILMPVYFN